MGKFNRGGDRGGFGGGKKFGGRDRSYDRDAPREMHKAICAECGDECEVPFKPSGDRPVLCSNCFKNSRGEDRGERREERRDFDRPRNEDRRMYDATCAECGQRCQVPFQPKPGRDIFCSDCFGKDKGEGKSFSAPSVPKGANYDQQFAALNSKLDKLIYLLTPKSEVSVKPPFAKATEGKPADRVAEKKSTYAKASEDKSASAKATEDKSEEKDEEKKTEVKKIAKKEDKNIAPKKKVAKKK
jgi:CxxC-x17-CxxC domain-containing protein